MIDYTEISHPDDWELFCRDYLVAHNLVVEVPPGRGADDGRDLLVREQLRGTLTTRSFTWLVSCKHYAASAKSVGVGDENNITDRMAHHEADGFIGFYSTIASSPLVTRLKELRDQGKIAAFEIYDAARIEAGFHDIGLSGVLLQHLPASHTSLRPIHPLLGKYVPLNCDVCGEDLLRLSTRNDKLSLISFAHLDDIVHDVHFVCKGQCDDRIAARIHNRGLVQGWDDIDDYCNPLIFFRRLTGHMAGLRSNPDKYTDHAHARMVELFLAVSQRVLRQTNEEDRKEYFDVREVEEHSL
ncbi:MAG: hypothetical protein OXQ89_22850 [Rhodospirillaceae bacterium]|nr:hypothetical protein [Rhodospirillaceae bacterium]MDE0000593.1 hypothetical protein [Rhodospirillaceae bacterium]MDE0363773.1 hypothetical protein [Rhodospirillaceae bacterium]